MAFLSTKAKSNIFISTTQVFVTAIVVRYSACYSIYFSVNLKLCISLDISIYSIIMSFKYCSNHPISCNITHSANVLYILKL